LYEEWRKLKNKFNDTNDPKIKKKMDDLTNESLDFYAKFTG
jgi:hypothetical protein